MQNCILKTSAPLRFITKNIYWIAAVVILAGFVKHLLLLHDLFGFSWALSVYDAVSTMVVISGSIWSILLLVRSYPTKVTLYTYALLISLLAAVIATFADLQIIDLIVRAQKDSGPYLLWLKNSMPIRFLLIWVLFAWLATNAALRKNMQALNSRFQQHTDAAALLKEAELFKLRQQLQPHFLYNSLNSISALVMISPDRAQEMIGKLSDFLRGSVRREAEEHIPIAEELRYIESYLAIESVRFGDRLKVNFEKDYDDKAVMPPFLFQPILENAIKFGLYGKTGEVAITISIRIEHGMLILKIVNPYDPDSQPPKGTGFGLTGVGRRLYLLYGRTDLLETIKEHDTFTTILKIPQGNVQGNTDR